jgi:hypothetical protein
MSLNRLRQNKGEVQESGYEKFVVGTQELSDLCQALCLYRRATEEESRKNRSQGSRKVPTRTVLATIRLVELAAVLRAAAIGLLTIISLSLRR